MTDVAASKKWGVSESFIAKLKRRVRETGSVEPINPKIGPKPKSEQHRDRLRQIVRQSPDLNPIELGVSKLKSVLRKLKIRDVGKLQRFLRRSPKLFSDDECKNYFRHGGTPVK